MHTIITKLENAQRISLDEALVLAEQCDVHTLGELAYKARTRMYGDKAYYVYNQHLNYTNICANQCRFCAFKKSRGDDGAYVFSVDDARKQIQKRADAPIREIHIVGGLNPDLPYEYYLELIAAVKAERPDACVKAFTAVEVAYLAQRGNKTHAQVLADMRGAGLGALPGGGAEVFSPALREKLCPEKVSGQMWLSIHRTAHEMGLKTNCTLLFGHIETWQDRLEHLDALRTLQDDTGGFICFIPLQYQPGNNELEAQGTDGLDYLKMIALSRLYLDNIPHLKAYWVFSGIKPAQMALHAGADDFDGTLVEEKVGHAAGADTPKGMTVEKLRDTIRQAGFTPVQRDTFFNEIED